MQFFIRLFAVFGLIAGWALPALGHPHAWITMRSDVQFNDKGEITALYIEWLFDKDYTLAAIDGLDTNKDGYYSADELLPLTEANIGALKDYDYFTYIKVDGKKPAYGAVTDFGQYHANEQLKMFFVVPLAKPVDPRKHKVHFMLYDPSFYIAMDFETKGPVTNSGKMPTGCSIDVQAAPADEKTAETKQMLSTKGTDWKPEVEQDFGAMFAQPVLVRCTPKAGS